VDIAVDREGDGGGGEGGEKREMHKIPVEYSSE